MKVALCSYFEETISMIIVYYIFQQQEYPIFGLFWCLVFRNTIYSSATVVIAKNSVKHNIYADIKN